MQSLYKADLAHIHVDGYDFHWKRAAPAILGWLADAGIQSGTIVDLGCGGGQWLARLAEKGYTPGGVEVSPAMCRLARKLNPSARIICGSFAEVELPKCDAVTSLGEPLNYLPGPREFKRTLRNVAAALRSGGLFIFDVRLPSTGPVETRVAARTGKDWACIARIEEDPTTGKLIRHITTFRRSGSAYRRAEEIHTLHLYSKELVLSWLEQFGFRVRTFRGYGKYRLGPGQIVFVARKPA